jgi:PAS domain S-box-containing protein
VQVTGTLRRRAEKGSHHMTDLRRAQEALRESEARYRTLFDTIDEGFCIIEFFDGPEGPLSDYVHIEANPAYARHAGIPNVVGQKVREMVPHEADGWVALYRGVLMTGEPIRFERELVATGRHLALSAFRVEPFERHQVAVLFQDVTARKRAEDALRLADARLRMALTAARMVTWQWDPTTDRCAFSDDVADVFGLQPGSAIESGAARDRLVHPDDLDGYRTTIARTIAQGGRYVTQFRLLRQDTGGLVWLEERGQAVRDAHGDVVQIVGLDLDISDRKRAEEARAESERHAEEALRESEHRLRQMADTMAHMIWVTRPDGYHEWYNRRWYEFTGMSEGSTDGDSWNGMFHPDDQARAWARWRHSLDTGEYYEIEYRLRHRSGEYRWVQGRALPIRNEHGQIERWFGTCTDIHALRQLLDERGQLLQSEQAARVESERAGRMKDEFLATLSHEIRTPLNAILGWATMLRSGRLRAVATEQGLEIIERNARAQAQMIEDLLDMSRIISGKLRLDVQRIDLSGVIRAAAETVAPAASAKGIRVQLVLDPLAGPMSGDPNRMQQVFWNLLSNAIKFTPKGGRVQVLLERVNSHLEASVVDTGEGIDPAFLPHVFDRFRQADASATRPHGGLGLGLAIAKQVVEQHGGTIRAKSPGKDRGASFILALPLTVIHPEVAPLPMRRHPEGERLPLTIDHTVQVQGIRVLVVDDQPDARALLRRLFEECGAVVSSASSAGEALALLQAERPDVLISDVGMPGEDGYSLIQRVRALPPEEGGRTPAIALTAYAGAEDRVRAVVAGFQHHLAKPIEPVELLVMVASLMKAR